MNAYSIGSSALSAGQQWLDTIGQNVANASTPGYHRQVVGLASLTTAGSPTGVDVASITRYTAAPARTAILRGNADSSFASARLATGRQVEALLVPTSGGIGDGLEAFFNQVDLLSVNPTDAGLRRGVIAAASDLAGRFNSASNSLRQVRADIGLQIPKTVEEVNGLTTRIASLNKQIAAIERVGGQSNDLQDQRDQLVTQLSQRIDVRTVQQPYGVVNVVSSGGAVVVGEFSTRLATGTDASGNMVVTPSDSTTPLSFRSGSLAAQLHDFNAGLPATQSRLDGLAREFLRQVNSIQATGLASTGPPASASGSVAVADPNATLATAGLALPVSAGSLTISITDAAVGTRSNTTVAIDPAVQSLNDVAAMLSGVPGLQASVGADNTLQLQAQSGFRFDFAGRDSQPPGSGSVAQPDSSGLLSALGIGGLFSGRGAADIAVRSEFQSTPGLLAASRTGASGDASNLEALSSLRSLAAVSGRSFGAEFTDLASSVGLEVSQLNDLEAAQSGFLQGLTAQEQAVVGVDVNEEMVHLLDAQRLIQSASKYLTVVNDAMDSLMSIIR